ncbi:MAG: diguanylate cyclase [Hyphomicrobiales bacterium]|nr:diguanylate cyclase [Hyphomicrobiales bacterium]
MTQIVIQARSSAQDEPKLYNTALETLTHVASREKNKLLCAAMDELPEGIVLLDSEGRYVHWNKSYADIYKATADLFKVGARLADTLRIGMQRGDYPEAVGREEEWYAERMHRLQNPGQRHEQQLADGRWILIEERQTPDNSTIGLRVDITEMKRREASFRLLFEENPIPMYVLDLESSRFLAINDAALDHYGFPLARFLDMRRAQVVCMECVGNDGAMGANGAQVSSERHVRADGSVIDVTTFSRQTTYDGKRALLVAAIDVTERNRSEARIAHMARHDALTDLPNRMLFKERLDAEVMNFARHKQPFAVFLIDLDHFKTVNDTLGHSAGDKLLEEVSAQLLETVSGPSTVARLGGDEFAVLHVGPQDDESVIALAGAIIAAVDRPLTIAGHVVRVGASVGIAQAGRDTPSAEVFLRNADIALYQAKAAGRSTYRCFEPAMDEALRSKLEFERDLHEAVVTRALAVHYQPIVELSSGIPKSMEALVRWTHPLRGEISPVEFIPVAEEMGLIKEVGKFVLETACRDAAEWPLSVNVAINVSPLQLVGGDFYDLVVNALSSAGLAPERLDLEITESLLMDASDETVRSLQALRDLGVGVSMDDFGTGYSSLSYLRKFPISKIKIDRSFIGDLGSKPEAQAIVRAIVMLGTSLGMDVVAEGIEHLDDLAFLRGEKCTEGQGFLFSRPVPSSDLQKIFERHGILQAGCSHVLRE